MTLVLGALFQLAKREGDEDGTYVIWVVEGMLWVGCGAEKGGSSSRLGLIYLGEGLQAQIIGLDIQ